MFFVRIIMCSITSRSLKCVWLSVGVEKGGGGGGGGWWGGGGSGGAER